MKRNIKNTIMIGMAAVLIGTSVITFAYAETQNRQPSGFPAFSESQSGENKQDFSDFKGNMPDSDNQQQPPQMPDSDSNQNSQPPQMPDSDSNQNSQPPQMPDSNQNSQQQSENGDSKETEQNSNSNSSTQTSFSPDNQQLPENTKSIPQMKKGSKVKSMLCYAFLAVQLAILLMIIAYLIISKMNKKSFNQLFPDNK